MKNLTFQNLLWRHLDGLDIAFRSPKADLICEFGAKPCGWTDNLEICELQSKSPFIEGLTHPISFQFNSNWDQTAPPSLLNAYIRDFNDVVDNFRIANEKLEAVFGVGIDNSVSNTVSKVWTFSKGSLTATIFPPKFNAGPNARHRIIAGSATECSIQIMTEYRPPLSTERLSFMNRASLVCESCEEALPSRLIGMPSDTQFSILDGSGADIGTLKIDANSNLLFYSIVSETVDVLSLDWVVSVRYTVLKPARGAGGIVLVIPYRPQGRYDVPEKHLRIIDAPYVGGAYHDLANALADVLSVELLLDEQDDI